MQRHGEHGSSGGASTRPLAAMIVLVSAWWLTMRDAAAAGGAPESIEASQWTMWLVAGPMLLAALYVWRSVFIEIDPHEAPRTGGASTGAPPPPTSSAAQRSGSSRDSTAAAAPAAETAHADAADRQREPTPTANDGGGASTTPANTDASPATASPAEPAGPASEPGVSVHDAAHTEHPEDAKLDDAKLDDAKLDSPAVSASADAAAAASGKRPHTDRIGDSSVDQTVALHAAVKLLASSAHGAVVFSTDASDEANAVLDRIAEAMKATRYVAGTGPNVATAERLAAEGELGRRALHEMELALAIAGRGIDVVIFADERGDFGELTLRSLSTMDSICLADSTSPTSEASRVLIRFDGEPERLRVLTTLLDGLVAARDAAATPPPTPPPADAPSAASSGGGESPEDDAEA